MLERADVTAPVIGAAIAVHRQLGPGLAEKVYERALACELQARGMPVKTQWPIEVHYHGQSVGRHVLDLLVRPWKGGPALILEAKAFRCPDPVRVAQARRQLASYLAAAGLRVGLVLNFANSTIAISRVLNPNERSPDVYRNGSDDARPRATLGAHPPLAQAEKLPLGGSAAGGRRGC